MSVRTVTATCLSILCAFPLAAGAQAQDDSNTELTAYEDRLIEGGALPADVSSGTPEVHDGSGWSRTFRVQATTSRVTRNDLDQDEDGLRFGGMLDTPNYGALTLEANFRAANGYGDDSGNLFTLYQFGLPMDGGWLVNNTLGVSSTPLVGLARSQYRFFLPAIVNNGLATEWSSADGLQLQASAGQPGQLVGIYVPTFEDLGGRQVSGGAQWTGANGWSGAIQAIDVERVRYGLGQQAPSGSISSQSWLGSVAWSTLDTRVQLSLLQSTANDAADGVGVWLDAALRSGRIRHTLGAFRMEPDLVWGNQPMSSNIQGGYYRAAFQSRQWLLDGGIDQVTVVSGDGSDTLFATAYARYQATSRAGLGGGGNFRDSETDAWSIFGFVDQQNRLGIGRAQADYATDDTRDNLQLTVNQTWRTPPSTRFSSSLLLGREELAGDGTSFVGLALNGGGDVRSGLALDLNARWDNAHGPTTYDNILASVALNWMLPRGWSLGANYYVSRNTGRVPLEVGSPIPGVPDYVEQRSDDEGFFVSMRYEWRAGTRSAPLAGMPGVGSGSVTGVLYLDENDNGLHDAGEGGAANVVVLLNGRFAARTGPEGRFEFPSVAAGTHVLTVVPDNLPLPWMFPAAGGVSVTVGVRDRVFVPLAAQRLR